MILSVSRKTDIPTFYGQWFRNRLRAGYCKTVNAYNRRQHRTVSLRPGDVDGYVFWTKNCGPFFDALDEVHETGVPFVVHYTVNPYPRAIERAVVDTARAVRHCHTVAQRYGPLSLVWRYDPVIVSELTPPEWHVREFANLAAQLEGCCDEVATKFVNPYRKTRRGLDQVAAEEGCRWWDPPADEKAELLQRLAVIAARHGLALRTCCQTALLGNGVEPAICIDAARLTAISGRAFAAPKRPIRAECRCAASLDIGEYDTCPHGCAYCYAVQRRPVAIARHRQHDPLGEYLFRPETVAAETEQLALF